MIKNEGELINEVRALQGRLLEAARPYFVGSEPDDLRCIIRLNVEFYHYLQDQHGNQIDASDMEYLCESIFSGVGSLQSLKAAFRMVPGETAILPPFDRSRVAVLEQTFRAKYNELLADGPFQQKLRLLLELFKLQIIFAGLYY